MALNVMHEVAKLQDMTVKELRGRYLQVFGERARSGNKDWLWKRIIWRMQSLEQGDLTERARRRAEELANDADLRVHMPVAPPEPADETLTQTTKVDFKGRVGRPVPGTVLTRPYKGKTIRVMVLDKGFEYEGQIYPSLTAVARAITGGHWSGNYFFFGGKDANK